MRSFGKQFLFAVVLLAGLSGCSKKEAAPQSEAATPAVTEATPVMPAAPAPAIPAPKQMRLSRDPFRHYVGGGGVDALDNVSLSALRYVGLVTNENENFALLEDEMGHGYTARIGTRIGRDFGSITQINQNEVVVRVTRKDESGQTSTKLVQLPFLPK